MSEYLPRCIGDQCKKITDFVVKFVNSVDPNIQKKIEDDIALGELSEQNIRTLEYKQEEIRNLINSQMFSQDLEMTVANLRNVINQNPTISPNIKDMIKDVFTFYYSNVLDQIPKEQKENMTDTVESIRNLDSSIELMYCIELICNPDDYVMNYELDRVYSESDLNEEIKKCSIATPTNNNPPYEFKGTRDPLTGITTHHEKDPSFGIRQRKNPTQSVHEMNRGGKNKKTRKNSKTKKAKKNMKTKKSSNHKKSKKIKAKKTKGKKSKKNTKKYQ